MKKPLISIVIAVAILSFQPSKTFAIQGACSSHSGVNCSKFDSDGSAICNDGWVNSSVGFYSVDECNNCSSYLYHTGCKNKSDLDVISNDYGRRGLVFSGAYVAAKNQCDAEIQDYSEKQGKYQQCIDLQDEAAKVWSSHLDTKLNQLLEQASAVPQCPSNSVYSNATNSCLCISGYVVSGNVCISATQACKNKLGPNSYGDTQYCYCSSGYQLNESGTSCVPTTYKADAQSTKPTRATLIDPYAQLTSDERCAKLGLGTFFNTNKQSCDACPSGTTRVAGTDSCQKPASAVKKTENITVQAIPVIKTSDVKKVVSSEVATTSQVTTSSTKADSQASKPTTFWQKIMSPIKNLWGRIFK